MSEPLIITETKNKVGYITLNRAEALNALNLETMNQVVAQAKAFDADQAIGAIVITGFEKAFAAGADIKEMSDQRFVDMHLEDFFSGWDEFGKLRTPLIAAVSGYALGGGCELAMMCDIVLASENAKFGQPEITLGVIPGMGGTQRLPRAVGKYKAAELILTGRLMSADEAERAGLVSRVVADGTLMHEATEVAETIASMSLPVIYAAKAALQQAQETTLNAGREYERLAFAAMFALHDQAEGMQAFIEKRPANFRNE